MIADTLCRQHDAAAFLAAGAQNDAVEALELLAAAAEQEMRAIPQRHSALRPAAGNAGGGRAAGLALLLDPPCREAGSGDESSGIRAASSRHDLTRSEPAPSQQESYAADGRFQQCVTAAAADVSEDVILDGATLADSRESVIQQETELLTEGRGAEPGIEESAGVHNDGGGAPALSAGTTEPQQGGPVRLPLQGLQAHELVCGRCGTPRETQLAPFFVLPLGASAMG